jgi:hypothetical protein
VGLEGGEKKKVEKDIQGNGGVEWPAWSSSFSLIFFFKKKFGTSHKDVIPKQSRVLKVNWCTSLRKKKVLNWRNEGIDMGREIWKRHDLGRSHVSMITCTRMFGRF